MSDFPKYNHWNPGHWHVPHQAEAVEQAFRMVELCQKSFQRAARQLANISLTEVVGNGSTLVVENEGRALRSRYKLLPPLAWRGVSAVLVWVHPLNQPIITVTFVEPTPTVRIDATRRVVRGVCVAVPVLRLP